MEPTQQPLDGRVVLITGGSGALGRSHALTFAESGASIVVSDLTDPSSVVEEITAAGGRAIGVTAGVDTWEGGRAGVDAAIAEYGRLDVVINNAGIIRDKSFAKMTPEMIESVLAVHLHGAFHVTVAAWPHLAKQGGSVIMTSSGTGLYGNYGQANYGAAKLGLVGLTRTLAQEGARSGIRVNAIAPLARSAMTEGLWPEALERLAPEWVSPFVVWLTTDDCTATGQIYSLGAGRYARVAILEGPGVRFEHVPTLADFTAVAAEIDTIEGAVEPANLLDQVNLLVPPRS
ncbi:MAG: SDR family NAD(P)-dependent oxidoreductase [Austwickia sp.]|jgi:NAD(P)-dependent dehydrogenase (short-subunit alcohol dehydrogenase family)|nr:SDR family NAD(P)-dependent oxidoreductase [Austwickia sp.]